MIDLHTHSLFSDGSFSPEELIREAEIKNLSAIALTDHDTLTGIPDFMKAAAKSPVRAIPGVEISTWLFAKEIHIVGLFINSKAPELINLLEEQRNARTVRNEMIVEKLNALDYDITMDELRAEAAGESIGRPHIASVLIKKGYFNDVQHVFDVLLKRGRAAYVSRQLSLPERAIAAIHHAGGVAIWAHPISGQNGGERTYVRKMLKHLVPAGLDGVETRYTTFSRTQTEIMEEMAKTFSIFCSGGSDFHGRGKQGIEIGTGSGCLNVPDEYISEIMKVLPKYRN